MTKRIAYLVAVWFGCGLSPVAPGTVGALGALPVYFLVRGGGPLAVLAVATAVTLVGVWAAGVVASSHEDEDPQIIVVDEVAGTLFALSAAPEGPLAIAIAIALFRLFDIAKPFPVRACERLPGGWGIVIDDVAAGVIAAVIVAAARLSGALG